MDTRPCALRCLSSGSGQAGAGETLIAGKVLVVDQSAPAGPASPHPPAWASTEQHLPGEVWPSRSCYTRIGPVEATSSAAGYLAKPPMHNVNAAATSSLQQLDVENFSSLVFPASSLLTWAAAREAINNDLDPTSTDSGPSLAAFRNALISAAASDHLVILGSIITAVPIASWQVLQPEPVADHQCRYSPGPTDQLPQQRRRLDSEPFGNGQRPFRDKSLVESRRYSVPLFLRCYVGNPRSQRQCLNPSVPPRQLPRWTRPFRRPGRYPQLCEPLLSGTVLAVNKLPVSHFQEHLRFIGRWDIQPIAQEALPSTGCRPLRRRALGLAFA